MSVTELVLRMASVTLLAFVAILWLRDSRGNLVGPMGALFCFAIASYLLCPPLYRHWQLGVLEAPFFFGCYGAAVFFWLMSRAIFDDGFRLRLWHGGLLLIMEVLGVWQRLGESQVLGAGFELGQVPLVLHQLLSLGITVSALILAFLGRAGDLVEARRRFRDLFVGVSGVYILIILATEIFLRDRPAAPGLELVNVAAIFVLVFAFAIAMVQLKPTLVPAVKRTTEQMPAMPPDAAAEKLLRALQDNMEAQFLYRQDGLTIAQLADRLGTQEYRLRRLINGRLGYRNFNEFLNSYRINEARDRLSDPEYSKLPILTIAMDAGFASLGPFNRAFKATTGMTPKDYRARRSATAKTEI